MRIFNIFLFCFIICYTNIFGQETDTITNKPRIIAYYNNLNDFAKSLNQIFDDPLFANAHWGCVIQSLNTGEYIFTRNENKNFMPASNMKLFTTGLALLKLGPDFKYETSLYLRGKLGDETIYGDLIIRGSGDPSLTGRFHNNDPLYVFSSWADSLLNLGIEEITGNIIADDDAFDDIGLGDSWAWDDETYYYAAPTSAVSLNDNCVDISITPGSKIGSKALIIHRPNTKYVTIFNDVITVPDDSITKIEFFRERGTNLIRCYGTIRKSENRYTESVTVNNPTQFAAVVFKEILESKGIKVKGYATDNDELKEFIDYSRLQKLLVSYSPPLSEIVKVINKISHNLYAELLLKTMGYVDYKYGTSLNGIKSIRPLLIKMGINPDSFGMVDGSGLSRKNLVTPMQISKLLFYLYHSKVFDSYYNSLPIAGVDGTISKRMINTKAQNNVRAKTGYINGVRALSGYVRTADNELLSFSILVNNFMVPVGLAENIQDTICNILANFSRGKKFNE